MDFLIKNYITIIISVICLIFLITVGAVIYLRIKKSKNNIERFYSKCCPTEYPDLVYDWKNLPTCYNKNGLGTDPKKNCLPPNFLNLPFLIPKKPRNYIF